MYLLFLSYEGLNQKREHRTEEINPKDIQQVELKSIWSTIRCGGEEDG